MRASYRFLWRWELKPIIDLNREYGIVLEGGGAKGAYQIGAWKALLEAGVKIAGVAGTSVGAINGALMCMGDYETAEKIWENISYSQIMDVDDEMMRGLFSRDVPWKEFLREVFSHVSDGGMDVTPLRQMLEKYVDPEAILQSPMEFYVLTFYVDRMKELEIDMKTVEPDMMVDSLLASAYLFPLFKNEKIRGATFIDGGTVNNVPLSPLVERGYKDIIVIRIFGIGHEKRVKVPDDTEIITIAPRVSLGNLIDFDGKKSRRNMTIGYYDAMRVIYGLSGVIYYIDESEEECYYLRQLIDVEEEVIYDLQENYQSYGKGQSPVRALIEELLPLVATELKLSPAWTYRELYLAVMEATAKMCHIKKYHIYTLQQLKEEIINRKDRLHRREVPAFVQLITGVLSEVPEIDEKDTGG